MGSRGGNPSRFCWCLVTPPGPHSLAAPAPTVGKNQTGLVASEPIPEQMGQFRPMAAVNINAS